MRMSLAALLQRQGSSQSQPGKGALVRTGSGASRTGSGPLKRSGHVSQEPASVDVLADMPAALHTFFKSLVLSQGDKLDHDRQALLLF